MKKRIFSILLCLCMVLLLLPITAKAMVLYVDLNITGAAKLTLDVESGDSVINVKNKIYVQTGYPVAQQVLKFGDKLLEDDHTLAYYNIQKESTLVLSLSVPYGLNYDSSGSEVTITGYTGSAAEIAIPDKVDSKPVTSIGARAFENCSNLTSVTIPDSVTSIGTQAFLGCASLKSVTFVESSKLESIGRNAFQNCTSLTSINIPDGVTSIGDYAFINCTSLTSITIPGGVASIEDSAFYSCTSLTSITVDESNENYSSVDGVLFNKNKTVLIKYPDGKAAASYSIPDSVTSIGNKAFTGCTNLKNITIPDGVTSIEDTTFFGCTSLESVTFGEASKLESINRYAFYNCTSLTNINIPDSVTSIGTNAFSKCTSLTNINIPDSVTSIGTNAFSNCTSLTSITIPGGVTSIGNVTFYNCTSLTSITIPDGVTSVGDEAFGNCTSLESIFLPDKDNLTIGSKAIPDTTSQVKYSLDAEKGEVTITGITLGTDKTSVAIPATICGYPVTAVEESLQSKVGAHTCKGGTATCAAKAVCSICGKEYGEPAAHKYEWKSENGQYWQKCQVCQYETAKKDIPEITIDAPDKVCRTQDCKVSVTLPDGITNATLNYEFLGLGGNIDMTVEDGKLNGVVTADGYVDAENSFNFVVYATTDDGFPFNVSKTVEIQNEHAGGTATCTAKAVCDTCGKEYGELDSANHDLEKILAKDATAAETGNKEYWHCKDCGKCFADEKGEIEIKFDDTVIAKLPPEIIKGKGQSVTQGDKKEITFKSNAAYSDFIRVQLDGKTLDEKNYTVKEGSTVVTLNADYVATLSAGEHTIGIVSESGTATTTFTVNAKAVVDNDTKNPQTGDNSHMALWIALLLVSGGALTVTGVYIKRAKSSRAK